MQRSKKRPARRHRPTRDRSSAKRRELQFQTLESRRLLAGDVPLADITGLWLTVGGREYFTSEKAAVTIDMVVGETLQVTGVEYGLDQNVTAGDGVIAFESYVRREHGATVIGSYDYTDGRFADPVAGELVGGSSVSHPGFDSGWLLDVIDNRVAVVAIRYFEDTFVVEDRLLVDVNVSLPPAQQDWAAAINPVSGQWSSTSDGSIAAESYADGAGLTVVETGSAPGSRFEIGVKAKTIAENEWANGFVVVDYRSENDFVYAGLRSDTDQWVIGQFDGAFNDLATIEHPVEPRQLYDLRVAVDGSHVALASDGVFRVSHDFDRPLDQGAVGLANEYAFTHFTDFHLFKNNSDAGLIATVTDSSNGTTVSFADGSAGSLSDAQLALEAAIEVSAQANQASEAAIIAAENASQAMQQALSAAEQAAAANQAASSTVIDVSAAHDAAMEVVARAEADAQSSQDLLLEAELAVDQAAGALQEAETALAVAQQAADDAVQQNQPFREAVAAATIASNTADQVAADAVSASETANAAAIAARAEADRLDEVADNASGSDKKDAKKAAKEADKIADQAEQDASEAAEAADVANRDASDAAAILAQAQADAASSDQAVAQTQEGLLDAEQNVVAANQTLDTATHQRQLAHDAVVRANTNLQLANDEAADLAQQLDHARDAATDAAVQLSRANEAVRIATGDANNADETAARLAHEAALAAQAVGAAALAVEQASNDDGPSAPVGSLLHVSTAPTVEQSANAYALNFNYQDGGAFETVLGSSELVAGQMHLVPGADSLAVSVMDSAALPERATTRVYTTVRADSVPQFQQNGFIVFDYQSPEDFKYAGAWAGEDRWAIGEMVDGQLIDVATLDEVIGEGPAYELQIWIEGSTLSFLVEGQQKLQHTFDQPVDDGRIGVASDNAQSRFDQVAVMKLHDGAGDAGIDQTDPAAATDEALAQLF